MQKRVPGFAVISSSFPYLGTSADGKVFDLSTDSRYGLLEIKCPFSEIGETLDQAAADPNVYLEKVGGKCFLQKEHTKYRDKYIICQTQNVCSQNLL